jgi:hypothetical protein
MADLKEQHVCIKFCFKPGKNVTETFKMLKVCFGKQTMGRTQVLEWSSKFKSSVTSVEDDVHSVHPSMSKTDENVDQMKEHVHKNTRLTIHEVANMLHISFGSLWSILKDNLNMH